MGLLLLLKRLMPGGAGADLFATPTKVEGYTKSHGHFVAPHIAIRHKKLEAPETKPAPKPAQADLFSVPAQQKPVAPAAPTQHDLFHHSRMTGRFPW